jgi:hypothetical protein
MYVLVLTKNGLGYVLGEFFLKSSGHPDAIDKKMGWAIFWATFSQTHLVALVPFDKNGLGYILGDFFIKSSSHPDSISGRMKSTF